MPPWVARLPTQIGYPAGGSLTADEWKALGLVFGPIVVRFQLFYEISILLVVFCLDTTDLGRVAPSRQARC
jgi:hypothetical protein